MPHLEFTGASVITGLKNGIGPTDLTCELNDGSNWPTGAGGKNFIMTLGDASAGQAQEKCLCSGRSNGDITIVSRGYDGTAPQEWGPNTRARHTISGIFAAEVSDHIFDTVRDDHTQYHTAARHAAVLHTLGMMGSNSVGASQIIDAIVSQAKLAKPSVGTPELITGSVVAGPIPNLGIVTALLDNLAVTTAKLADLGVTGPKIADTTIPLAKFASEAPTDFSASIAFDNVTLGTGGTKYAHYFKLGRLVLMFWGFQLGTGGDVTGKIGFNLPHTPADLTAAIGNRGGLVVGRAVFPGVWSGTGAILDSDNKATDIITAGGSVSDTWDDNTPHDWGAGSVLQGIVVYAATA